MRFIFNAYSFFLVFALIDNAFSQRSELPGSSKLPRSSESLELKRYNCTLGPESPGCDRHGECVKKYNMTDCLCDPSYVTLSASDIGCTYKQKDPLIAFLLELFLGIECGAGLFYLGLYFAGVVRSTLFLIVCFIMYHVKQAMIIRSEATIVITPCGQLTVFITALVVLITWIVDLIAICQGTVDGSGIPVPGL